MPASTRLSKSRFVAGLQCHKLLWWMVHEPTAVELQPDIVLQDRFDQAAQVGALARARHPGGALVETGRGQYDARIRHTKELIDAKTPVIFEAAFEADGVFAAVDILERSGNGYTMTEVKAANSLKDEHVPDAAVQAHVLQQNGLTLGAVNVLHLNREFHHPNHGDLFQQEDVSQAVTNAASGIPEEIKAQQAMLQGPLPTVPIGRHCAEPRECPFMDRCWPQDPDHISKLYNVGPARAAEYMRKGITSISQLPITQKMPHAARRQLRAMKENRLIVDPGLKEALEPFSGRLGYLDFETISRAVPVWDGMAPWEQAAAQFSYHERQPDGRYTHTAFLAEGPQDARPPLARAMLEATKHAERVVMYTPFERTRIRGLQEALPDLAPDLLALENKLIDLHPVIRDYVYHPAFLGSFSIKYVLKPLVPELSYSDLVIVDGLVASVEIARLLFVADKIRPEERDRVRQDLLDYCERDTWAMVRLVERLTELAKIPAGS